MEKTTRNVTHRIQEINRRLSAEYGEVPPFLEYSSGYQLLIAVILSAQTTDAQVNRVTPALFRRYPSADSLAEAQQNDVERIIHSTGFYRVKAQNIIAAARTLVEEFNTRIPDTIEELIRIPGVGRKTANVVISHLHGRPGVIVDTHFSRVVRRLELNETGYDNGADRLEQEMRLIIPERIQTEFSMRVNLHGRKVCTARKPRCPACILRNLCRYPDNETEPIILAENA
jgi:endonuclease III